METSPLEIKRYFGDYVHGRPTVAEAKNVVLYINEMPKDKICGSWLNMIYRIFPPDRTDLANPINMPFYNVIDAMAVSMDTLGFQPNPHVPSRFPSRIFRPPGVFHITLRNPFGVRRKILVSEINKPSRMGYPNTNSFAFCSCDLGLGLPLEPRHSGAPKTLTRPYLIDISYAFFPEHRDYTNRYAWMGRSILGAQYKSKKKSKKKLKKKPKRK